MIPQREILRMAIQATAQEMVISRRRLARISDETMQEFCEEVENRLRETHLWGFMVDYPQILPEHILDIFFNTDEEDWRERREIHRRHQEYWENINPSEYWENVRHLNF